MAPITRSSLHGRSISREGSWQIPTEEDLPPKDDSDKSEAASDVQSVEDPTTEEDQSDDEFDDNSQHEQQGLGSPIKMPSGDTQNIFQPLQQTADRVSRQVEDFARRLDRFHSARDVKHETRWKDALDLAALYGSIAVSRKSQTSFNLLQARHPSRSRQDLQTLVEEGQREIQRAQKEADLWEIFGILTSLQEPEIQATYSKTQKSCLRGLHRYSSDSEIWQTFLSADQSADEYQELLAWLCRNASGSRPSIHEITESLRHKADRGDGIWSAGWLFTKESIKTQKRNRSWPKPLEHSNPGLENSHIRKSDARPLVAQLDPDAQYREAAALEKPDEYHEEAAWVACWEMLRRDASTEMVREWWSERKESWRALSTRGAMPTNSRSLEREWTRFTGLWRANDWAASCYRICHSDTVSTRHEAAVFGLLCGDVQTPLQVCENTDDYLFVHLNAFLIERYRDFGNALSQKESRHTFQPAPSKFGEIRRLMQYCQNNEKTTQEWQDPFKIIQGTIVSKDFDSFFLRYGRALARITGKPSFMIASDGVHEMNESAQIAASDPDSLRIVVHLQLILKSLGCLDDLYTKHEQIVENNLAAYISWLQQQGKIALIPLYASSLSAARGARVLGAVIMDITDLKERDMMINLIKSYDMDVSHVLVMQYRLNAETVGLAGNENPTTITKVNITEYVGSGRAKNLKVKPGFIGEGVKVSEDLLIRSLEWYGYGDKQCWSQACRVASTLYKTFLCRGRLSAARELCRRAQLSTISRSALKVDLKNTATSGNTSAEEDVEMDGFEEDERAMPISPSKRRNLSRRPSAQTEGDGPNDSVLAEQAQTWRHLEELVEALDAFEKWNGIAEEVEKTKGDHIYMRAVKKVLQAALDDVRNAMFPLLDPEYLSRPSDEAEVVPLKNIRNHYLPECVLAYNSVLHFAGYALTRNCLVECMNLAQEVATNETLTDAFVESSRMKELVTAFALSSQALLHANEQGSKKGKKDEAIEIWQVKPQDVGLSKDG